MGIGFQFHKGSIKTEEMSQLQEQANKFQFHKGSIKTIIFHFILSGTYPVSIPQRFD